MSKMNNSKDCHKYYWSSSFKSQLPNNLPPNTIIITGFGPPSEDIGNIGDIYIDLSTGEIYEKIPAPAPSPPSIRPLPTPSLTTIDVSPPPSGDASPTIQAAIDSVTSTNNHIVLSPGTFNIDTTLTIPSSLNTSVTIEGSGIGNTILVSASYPSINNLTDMFTITNGNVTIKNMSIVHNYNKYNSDNDESAILINNTLATGIYIDNCDFSISEFAINTNAAQIQVTNCIFKPNNDMLLVANRYGCIYISNSTGNTIISNNQIITTIRQVVGNAGACSLVRITNVPALVNIQGKILISNNTQSLISDKNLRHLLLLETDNIQLLQLFIINNKTFLEGNAPILFPYANLNKYSFIQLKDNNVQNTAGKGLLAFYLGYTATNNTSTNTNISLINNTISTQSFNYPPWISATTPSTFDMGVDYTMPYQLLYFQTASYWYNTGQTV